MLETIFQHRSIRKFLDKKIPEVVFKDIIDAATRASTTGNMQVYSIIVTQDKKRKKELMKYHFNQQMVAQAPVILTFCADFNRFNKWCEYRKAEPGYDNYLSFFTAAIDALLVAQNAALAAEDEGLGICYLGTTTYNAPEIAKFLSLPKHVVPVTTIALGYPDEDPELTDRLPNEAVVHFEKYVDFDRKRIDRIYAAKEKLKQTKKLIEENKTETLAQIFTDKRYTKKDNEFFSDKFLNFIKEQGFLNH